MFWNDLKITMFSQSLIGEQCINKSNINKAFQTVLLIGVGLHAVKTLLKLRNKLMLNYTYLNFYKLAV